MKCMQKLKKSGSTSSAIISKLIKIFALKLDKKIETVNPHVLKFKIFIYCYGWGIIRQQTLWKGLVGLGRASLSQCYDLMVKNIKHFYSIRHKPYRKKISSFRDTAVLENLYDCGKKLSTTSSLAITIPQNQTDIVNGCPKVFLFFKHAKLVVALHVQKCC